MCDFSSGWIAGMMGLVTGHPFDTVKVNQQTSGLGPLQCMKNIFQQNGIKGYFRGLAFPLVANGAMNSLFFGVYGSTLDALRLIDVNSAKHKLSTTVSCDFNTTQTVPTKLLEADYHKPSHLQIFLAGGIAGLAQLMISCPVEVIKIKLQTQAISSGLSKAGPLFLLKDLAYSYGFRGIYQGALSQSYRDIPASAVYMLLYEFGSRRVKEWGRNKHETANMFGIFVAGGIAGTVSWWAILPFDVIKSRIQADDHSNPKYKGMIHCTNIVLRQQGIKGLFRGFWSISLRAFPVNGVTFITLEWLKTLCSVVS